MDSFVWYLAAPEQCVSSQARLFLHVLRLFQTYSDMRDRIVSVSVRMVSAVCLLLVGITPVAYAQELSHRTEEPDRREVRHAFYESRAYLNNADALDMRVDLRFVDEVPRSKILAHLAGLAGFRLVFDADSKELNTPIQLVQEDISVLEALQQVVSKSGLFLSLSPDGKLLVRKHLESIPVQKPRSDHTRSKRKETGIITGTVRDAVDGEALAGANVIIEGTPAGAATDLEGRFRITNVPAGPQTIVVRYIGYQTERVEVTVIPDQAVTVDIALRFDVSQIEEVVISAQASGQAAAINQQLSSNKIINVVSAERIQELPDANVAESIARLPGISVERDAGEGQKIVIRGLAPQYNAVTINGVAAPATDEVDRSVDLNMIAQEMLSSIEVTKALTPDQDADALGGSVNLNIREAPGGFRSNLSFQSGFASQKNTAGIYRGNAVLSNRILNGRLGFILTGSVDRADRGSDVLRVDYFAQGNPSIGQEYVRPRISNQLHQDNLEDRRRYGGSAIIDFRLRNGYLKSTNFMSRLDRDRLMRISSYTIAANWATYELRDITSHTNLMSNALQGLHHFGNVELDWGASRQRALSKTPSSHRIRFRELGAFSAAIDSLGPDFLTTGANHNIANTFLYAGDRESSRVVESEYVTYVNLTLPFRIGEIAGYVKAGAKLRDKSRVRHSSSAGSRLDNATWSANMAGRYPNLRLLSSGFLAMDNWTDPSFDDKGFLNGRFSNISMNSIIDEGRIAEIYDDLDATYIPTYQSTVRDYDADERVTGFYAMSEVNIGRRIMLLPGFRFEHGRVRYKGYNGTEPPDGVDEGAIFENLKDTTATHSSGQFLPMIHLRLQGARWFDVRLAYTETLSRPNYDMLSPRRVISHSSETVRYGSVDLDPARSRNYDAILSMYGNRLGLLAAGIFHKRIRDFAYTREVTLVAGTESDPTRLNLPLSTRGYLMFAPTNNTFEARVTGLEFEWQTYFRYLPQPFDGIVLSLNYSYIRSETSYPRTEVHRNFGEGPRLILVDTSVVAPLLLQPKHIMNASLGYDRGGFSGRISFNYQGSVLTNPGRRTEEMAMEEAFYRWDLMVSQHLTPAVSVFFNMNNISNQPDESTNFVSGYPTGLEYYGYTFNLGVRWRLR